MLQCNLSEGFDWPDTHLRSGEEQTKCPEAADLQRNWID